MVRRCALVMDELDGPSWSGSDAPTRPVQRHPSPTRTAEPWNRPARLLFGRTCVRARSSQELLSMYGQEQPAQPAEALSGSCAPQDGYGNNPWEVDPGTAESFLTHIGTRLTLPWVESASTSRHASELRAGGEV